jgi:hypothetical protein
MHLQDYIEAVHTASRQRCADAPAMGCSIPPSTVSATEMPREFTGGAPRERALQDRATGGDAFLELHGAGGRTEAARSFAFSCAKT